MAALDHLLACARNRWRLFGFDQNPRTLFVPYRLGFPLGEPNNSDLQHRIIAAALALLARNDVPVIEDFRASAPFASAIKF